MPDTARSFSVQHNDARHRFEVNLEGHLNKVEYELEGKVMRILHTVVNPALEGRGIASSMVAAALAHARAKGLKVDPQCPYTRAYMQRHPETQDLLA
ncbi:MAG TPA: GNAT family N-acetyltransferase [Rhizobacter sp.]|nr:GNAT family N-acetyltransferase [Rhizobacter sp.]